MSASEEERGGKAREITYKVGWKKGRITLDGAAPDSQEDQEDAPFTRDGWMSRAMGRLFAGAPAFSSEVMTIYALLLPAVLFVLSLLLLYLMLN